jgi:ABC-type transport system involved in multi-copper enzyme maturation permease subunit
MRAYLAVLKDSFREALASRVLWILLALTTLLLLAVAPIALSEKPATNLRPESLLDLPGLVSKIAAQGKSDAASPGKQIWSLWSDDFKKQILKPPTEEGVEAFAFFSEALDALNKVLSERRLYDPAAWKGISLNDETRALGDRSADTLTDDEVKRRNRLLLEAAFPAEIANGRAELSVSYLVWPVTEIPVSRKEADVAIKAIVAAIISFLVGTLGVLAAILVTSPIIPHTFEAGAIDLLLSKPVSRTLLFLTKFAGGCAFILLNAAYFIVGLWLILGVRFNLWSGRLLLCIPVFLFLFAIYYAVSSLAGVLWRNAVVSIVVTVLFWATCFVVGTTKTAMEQVWLNSGRLVKVVLAGDSLIGVTEQGEAQQWRATEAKWEETFRSEQPSPSRGGPFFMGTQWVGPVYDARGDRLLAIEAPFAMRRFGNFDQVQTLWIANRSDGWSRREGPAAPAGATDIFVDGQGTVIAVSAGGVFRLSGRKDGEGKDGAGQTAEAFVPAGPVSAGPDPPLRLQPPFTSALNIATGEIAISSDGAVTVLQRDSSGNYSTKLTSEIIGDNSAALAFGGATLLAALSDGRVLLLDAATLEKQHELSPAGETAPRFAFASPNGRWFMTLFHNNELWLFDARAGKPASVSFRGQGDISAASFSGDDRVLVTDRVNRVTAYQLDPFQMEERRVPALTPIESIYHYAVVPIYTLFPKPGELGNVVSYLLTEQETVAAGPNAENLAQRRVKINIYGPVLSSFAFLVAVLGLTCAYVRRTDF